MCDGDCRIDKQVIKSVVDIVFLIFQLLVQNEIYTFPILSKYAGLLFYNRLHSTSIKVWEKVRII